MMPFSQLARLIKANKAKNHTQERPPICGGLSYLVKHMLSTYFFFLLL